MQAENFYRDEKGNSITLSLLDNEAFARKQNFTPYELQVFSEQQFTAQFGQIVLIINASGKLEKIYLGADKASDALVIANAATKIPPGNYHTQTSISSAAIVAWSLAQYRYDRYKYTEVGARLLYILPEIKTKILAEANAVFMVRNLINTPTNALGPSELAEVVVYLAKLHKAEVLQWVGDDLLTHNFPAIHAVGRAAHDAPRMISLTYGQENHPRVTLIGKGVCFDSGGLDIKTAATMRLMKKDMGGAAIAIGLAAWMMQMKLPVRLQLLIPAVENAVGSRAYRPGDILTMRNGLTVEIDNTDAEGRLVLADALVKASEDNPELIIDFSTLTGAARIAVGTEISALFSNDTTLANKVTEIGDEVFDPVWRLPLFKGYNALIESPIANLVNSTATSYAGAITAALFLQHFVPKSTSWMHIDTMAWNLGNKPGKPEGGEAMSMLAVGHYLLQRYGV